RQVRTADAAAGARRPRLSAAWRRPVLHAGLAGPRARMAARRGVVLRAVAVMTGLAAPVQQRARNGPVDKTFAVPRRRRVSRCGVAVVPATLPPTRACTLPCPRRGQHAGSRPPFDETPMEALYNPEIWIALATLTALELVLGIDNIIFISILAGRLP